MELKAPSAVHTEHEALVEFPRLVDISGCLKDMTEAPSFFQFFPEGKILPRYTKELSKVFHLGSWPLLSASPRHQLVRSALDCFCAIAPHGKLHVAEIFFADDRGYLGTHRAFTLQYPGGTYDSRFDQTLMRELAGRIFGSNEEAAV